MCCRCSTSCGALRGGGAEQGGRGCHDRQARQPRAARRVEVARVVVEAVSLHPLRLQVAPDELVEADGGRAPAAVGQGEGNIEHGGGRAPDVAWVGRLWTGHDVGARSAAEGEDGARCDFKEVVPWRLGGRQAAVRRRGRFAAGSARTSDSAVASGNISRRREIWEWYSSSERWWAAKCWRRGRRTRVRSSCGSCGRNRSEGGASRGAGARYGAKIPPPVCCK